jgi:hypothetical protein
MINKKERKNMRFSNVRVYSKGDDIQIRFDLIDFSEDYEWSRRDRTIKEALLDQFKHPDRNKVDETLDHQSLGDIRFTTKLNDTTVTVPCVSSTYRLPTDPVLALDFLTAYKNHISERNFNHVCFHHFSVHSYLVDAENPNNNYGQNKTLPGTLEQYISTGMTGAGWADETELTEKTHSDAGKRSAAHTSEILKTFVEKILAVAATKPNYKATFDALSKISKGQAQDTSVSFKERLDVPHRYSFLCNIPYSAPKLLDNNPAVKIERYVLAVGNKLTQENRTHELNHFIDNFQLNLKVGLFSSCVGKAAEDGGKYNWSYTEWALLKHAQFNIRQDGKLGIVLADNAGYREHYAQGRHLFTKMENEMRYLGSIIGLEFDAATDFHKELVFTSACSQRLLAAGMHLNPDRLKQLLQPQFKSVFFKTESTSPVTESTPVTSLEYRG